MFVFWHIFESFVTYIFVMHSVDYTYILSFISIYF